jgi:hypothetical protein
MARWVWTNSASEQVKKFILILFLILFLTPSL